MNDIQSAIMRLSYVAAFTILIVLLFYKLIVFSVRGDEQRFLFYTLKAVIESIMLIFAMLLMSKPEGLPLSISISTLFSTDNLKDENLLVKTLDALESSGNLTDILTGKTGTLTNANMHVQYMWYDNKFVDIIDNKLSNKINEKIANCLLFNSFAYTDIHDH